MGAERADRPGDRFPRLDGEGEAAIELGRGRRLVVRPVRVDDAEGLTALYDRLDADDRWRRFFCAFHPSATWFAELTTVAERGGARLVAELVDGSTATIVAEAGYTALPNGNGELAMAVERRWRGWLGPYLLARLCAIATVPNLEADVLAINRPMLGLLRHRGAVAVTHDGWSTVRLVVSTSGSVPTWGRDPGPRLLVEAPGGRWSGESAAEDAGVRVLTCAGPAGRACPALAGDRCPLVAGADAVIVRYVPGDAQWQALLDAHRRLHADATVLLEALGAPNPTPGPPALSAPRRRADPGGDDPHPDPRPGPAATTDPAARP